MVVVEVVAERKENVICAALPRACSRSILSVQFLTLTRLVVLMKRQILLGFGMSLFYCFGGV
jgi:hypothetical protein